jgi:N-acetylmuramoyl-L-alanine amidase
MNIGVDEIREWHLARGWSDIGYHFVIRRDGTVETGRQIDQIGAHARGHNEGSIGICLVGGMDETGGADCNYTKWQWFALDDLVEAMTIAHGVKRVIGHRDVSDKLCPCFDVKEWRQK